VAAGLAQASTHYATRGIGTVRDPAISPQGWRTYQRIHEAGRLGVRSYPMIMSPADLIGYPADPLTCPPEQLLMLSPAFTMINGRLAYRGG
jgi:predicted amidohydrolase YtcJ